jgi:hypothetical protein
MNPRFQNAALAVLLSFSTQARSQTLPLDFVHKVAPILKEHCGGCHTGDKKKGGFSMNSQEDWLQGSENGPVFNPDAPNKSKVLEVIQSTDPEIVMPPPAKDRARPSVEQIGILKNWILSGAHWEPGYAFQKPTYNAPVAHRAPVLPPAAKGLEYPLDRLLDAYLQANGVPLPPLCDDATFARRLHLDLVGLLPEPGTLREFVESKASNKREKLIDALLARNTDYTEHWLTFWNDLLRNDYGGTGFITGGRKQISAWLYTALHSNMPYDEMVRQLVNPNADTEGFAQGITWRGTVSASQTREIQYAQSISQAFLGLNLKCASCHDSFIDKWKLTDAYGLAAVFAEKPIEIARCEKLTGKTAVPSFPFPEVGQIDASKPRADQLRQLAGLITHAENGWFARTISNRFWDRLLGHGLVHPVDAMGTQPWSEEILDYLGWHLAQNRYDLKSTLRLIATSRAYQSQSAIREKGDDTAKYVFRGPRAKRLSAEMFLDLLWQIAGTAPANQDAPVRRGEVSRDLLASTKLTAMPIMLPLDPEPEPPATSEKQAAADKPARKLKKAGKPGATSVGFAKTVVLPSKARKVSGILFDSGKGRVLINGALLKAPSATRFNFVTELQLSQAFKEGENTILILQPATPAGAQPEAFLLELECTLESGAKMRIASDESWKATTGFTEDQIKPGKLAAKNPEFDNAEWLGVKAAEGAFDAWKTAEKPLESFVWSVQTPPPSRAALLKSDLLMRTLGRPNRDQIVTSRPQDLSTLEALDLSAGKRLSELLVAGAQKLATRPWSDSAALTGWLFEYALCRKPSAAELEAASELAGPGAPSRQSIEDLLWAVLSLPEFQLIR